MPSTSARARVRLFDLARSMGAYDLVEPAHSVIQAALWRQQGRPVPPPSAVKRATLREYGRRYRLRTLVETGTYKADTVRALRNHFERIYSIEVDEALHREASRRCRSQRNAVLLHGDSSVVLSAVLDELNGPGLFWLDAHYSGGATGMTHLETPVLTELKMILSRPVHGHVILIDDHREFVAGQVDYPTEDAVRELVDAAGYLVSEADDILRLVPPSATASA